MKKLRILTCAAILLVLVMGYCENIFATDEVRTGYRNLVMSDLFCAAQKEDGTIVTWGDNVFVPAGFKAVKFALGYRHMLALREDGSVVAFGSNYYNELNVPAGLKAKGIFAGRNTSLAIKEDGTLVVWGETKKANYIPAPDLFLIMSFISDSFMLIPSTTATTFSFGAFKLLIRKNEPAPKTKPIAKNSILILSAFFDHPVICIFPLALSEAKIV